MAARMATRPRGTTTQPEAVPPIDPNLPASDSDTIVAPSTPPGRSAVGVVRISGPRAEEIARLLVRCKPLSPRTATLGPMVDATGSEVDQVLATFYPGPASYTGEDVVEISCHGSPPVLRFAIERTLELGARLAAPGEFTRRAFRNGRMDLVQAEGVRDLIDATTLYQARVAARQTIGALSGELRVVKSGLVELIALLEAGIDFAEDDIEIAGKGEILHRLAPVRGQVSALVDGYSAGKVVRSGLKLAIVGRPNVGKSSLFNRLLGQDRAIVNATAGTTRDAISENASFDGIPVELVDTAGIRASRDAIESEGVERSWQTLASADCALVVVDLSERTLESDSTLWQRTLQACPALLVGNKQDLKERYRAQSPMVRVSAKTGKGVSELRAKILELAAPGLEGMHEGSFVTNIRQERLLRESLEALDKASTAVEAQMPHEMLLIDLYEALAPLDSITGGTTLDDILDRIFSTFCIGK